MDHRATRLIRRLTAVAASTALVALAAGQALGHRESRPATDSGPVQPAAQVVNANVDVADELNDERTKDDAAEVDTPEAPDAPKAPKAPKAPEAPDATKAAQQPADPAGDDQGENENVDKPDEANDATDANDKDDANEADADKGAESNHHDAAPGSGQHGDNSDGEQDSGDNGGD